MPLAYQTIPVAFSKLDTKTDPRWLMRGDLVAMENTRLDNWPEIDKRYGYERLVAADSGSVLTGYKSQLFLGTGAEAEAYTASSGALVDKGVLESLSLSVQPAVRNAYTKASPDMAVHPFGITVYASDSVESGTHVARYSVFDSETQQPIVSNVLIGTQASRPKTMVLGNYVVIIYFEGMTNHISVVAIPALTPSAPLPSADIALDPIVGAYFDAVVTDDQLYLVYATSDGRIAAFIVTSGLAVGAETTLVTSAPIALGVWSDASNNIWVDYYTSPSLSVAVFDSALAPVLAPTVVETGAGTVRNATGIVQSGTTATLLYEIQAFQTYNTLIRTATVTLAGAVSSVGVLVRSLGLASKPFLYLDRVHVLAAHQSALQSTYFLLSGSTVVGKVAPSVGGGLTSHVSALPESTAVSTGIYSMAYLQTDQLSSTGGDVFTQAGVQGATWDFNAAPVALELSDDLHVTGGLLSMYDGAQVCEHGFNIYPENLQFSVNGTGSFSGSYQAFAIYQWMDNYGLIHQSAPSPVVTVTATSNATFHYTIPTLRVTSKITPVTIAIYRTLANETDFFLVTSIAAPLLNDTTVDTVSTSDTVADATLSGNAQPYTNPDNNDAEVPNIAAPAPTHIARYRNRAVIIPAENPFQWIFSKSLVPGVPVEFNPQQLFQSVEQDGGPLTCSIEMDDKLILFSRDRVRYAVGDGPSPNGANSDYSNAYHVPSDVGCINARSLLLTPQGVMFQSAKGIYILGRDMSVQYIGAPVERFNAALVTSAELDPGSRRAVFMLDSGIALVYDYYAAKWSTWTNHNAADATVFGGVLTYVQPTGKILQQTPGAWTDDGEPILQSLTTSWLAFAGISGVQRVWRFNLRGSYRSPHILNVDVAVNDNPGTVQTERVDAATQMGEQPIAGEQVADVGDPGGGAFPPYNWVIKLKQQRSASVQVTIREQQVGPTYGEGYSLSAITFLAGVDKGTQKVPVGRAI